MPTAAKPALGKFDGRDVIQSTIAVTNAGDGLSKAMSVDPTAMHLHDKVFVVLECEVNRIGFAEVGDTGKVARVHNLKAGAAVIVDENLVREHLDEMAKRIEEAAGVHRLPLDDDDEGPNDGDTSD